MQVLYSRFWFCFHFTVGSGSGSLFMWDPGKKWTRSAARLINSTGIPPTGYFEDIVRVCGALLMPQNIAFPLLFQHVVQRRPQTGNTRPLTFSRHFTFYNYSVQYSRYSQYFCFFGVGFSTVILKFLFSKIHSRPQENVLF